MFARFFARGKTDRIEWDANAIWYRVRYADGSQLHQCLLWLAEAQKVGRVVLWFRVASEGAMLHIGLPPNAAPVFMRMAHDYGFSLQSKADCVGLPPVIKLRPLRRGNLPWHTSFVAHLVGGFLFVTLLEEGDQGNGHYLPVATKKQAKSNPVWTLPEPGRGLNQQPFWPHGNGAAALFMADSPTTNSWLLGGSQEGRPLQAAGQINLYGGSDAAAAWLSQMATHLIRQHPGNLIIIDGRGNLVPQLKRKNSVLRSIGSRIHYLDMDNDLTATGFNPLSIVPGETEAQTVTRWQMWMAQMGVHRSNLPVLAEAYGMGIRDFMGLVRWLELPAQQVREAETASLRHRLGAFLQSRAIQEWVDWPDSPFRLLPEGGLLFACHCSSWQRTQILLSVLLGALNSPDARLILHGIPWQEVALTLPTEQTMVISNGPAFAKGETILVRCEQVEAATLLGQRFFPDDKQMQENLHLLGQGEGVVVNQGQPIYITWRTT